MSRRWLVLDLQGPLVSFGGVAVDQVGPTRRFPAASALTGLIANAMGWDWTDRAAHQALQERLTFGSAILREGVPLTDVQNARLGANDHGWTTRGQPEGRAGASYDAPHRRRRDYLADARVRVVLTLAPGDPDLETVAAALDRPARPLFLGRKGCLPSVPIRAGWAEGATAVAALRDAGAEGCAAEWPEGEGEDGASSARDLPDLRDWASGLHTGARVVRQGRLTGDAP